jgi:hypothetical protein
MRIALALLVAAAALTAPLAAATMPTGAGTPIPNVVPNKVLAPQLKVATPSPTPTTAAAMTPPTNPTTPTLWVSPITGHPFTITNISESMSPSGTHGCFGFAVSASLNAPDAISILTLYSQHTVLSKANVYAPPIVYELQNAVIKSYSESDGPSGASVKFSLTAEKMTIKSGSTSNSVTVC